MDLRANAARNLTEFHEAFGVREGDGMWLAPRTTGSASSDAAGP